jgi:hypothetical protein
MKIVCYKVHHCIEYISVCRQTECCQSVKANSISNACDPTNSRYIPWMLDTNEDHQYETNLLRDVIRTLYSCDCPPGPRTITGI